MAGAAAFLGVIGLARAARAEAHAESVSDRALSCSYIEAPSKADGGGFVAIDPGFAEPCVMTSPDGVTWTVAKGGDVIADIEELVRSIKAGPHDGTPFQEWWHPRGRG